jgi:hydrogenase maturation factor
MTTASGYCETCADAATKMRVIALAAPLHPARCLDEGGRLHDVLLDLVDAAVGDEVLVHAGVAITATAR